MKTQDELWEWVWKEGWEPPPAGRERDAAEALAEMLLTESPENGGEALVRDLDQEQAEVVAPAEPAAVAGEPPRRLSVVEAPPRDEPVVPPVRPERAHRTERRRLGRRLRAAALVAVAGLAVAATVWLPREARSPDERRSDGAAVLPPQSVVAWTVWDQRRPGSSFVAVLATGGGLDPVAVTVPGNAAVSIPGHGLGTVDDAAATGDVSTVAATVENVLGLQIDDGWGIPLAELRDLVADLGEIPVEGRSLDGAGVVAYLREPGRGLPTERAIRWQAVLVGLVEAADERVAERLDVPDAVRPVFASPSTEVLALPVEDVGAGLARPDAEAVSALVTERFVPTGGEAKVRLVVLNGNGEPGLGQRVARLLVPQGFQLVASQNASEFGMRATKIIASDRGDLPAARKAQRLLRVGRVLLGGQDSGVADVTVVIGLDFGGP